MKSKLRLIPLFLALSGMIPSGLAAEVPAPPKGQQPEVSAAAVASVVAEKKPGYLGVVLDPLAGAAPDEGEAKDAKDGVGILGVVSPSPAALAELKVGDRILVFEGKKAQDSTRLRELIRAAQPEQNVKLMVRRDGKEMEIKVKLTAAPEAAEEAPVPGVLPFQRIVPEVVLGTVIFPDVPNRNPVILRGEIDASRPAGTSGSAKPPEEATDTVTLRDGNVFAGKIRGITVEQGLQLQREGTADLALIEEEIDSFALAERQIGPEPAKGRTPPPKVLLQLRDGSVLHGDALTMEQGTLRLTLPAAEGEAAEQRIEIPRKDARRAILSAGEATGAYFGPTGLSGWSSGNYSSGRWDFQDGFLRCLGNGPIGRDLGHSLDPIDLSFDVSCPQRMQQFSCTLFSATVSGTGSGALRLRFSPGLVSAIHFDGQRANQYKSEPLPEALPEELGDQATSIRYRVLVDRVGGRALIYVNGEKRAEWKLSKLRPEDLGKCGTNFSITPSGMAPGAAFQLGAIRVLSWDGREPAKKAQGAEPKGDQLFASDGTAQAGTLERITDSEMIFANPESKAKRNNTVFVQFAEVATTPPLPPAVATVRMKNGAEISAQRVRGRSTALTLTTRCGPELTVPLGALRQVDYLSKDGEAKVTPKDLDVLTLTDGTEFTGRAVLPLAENSVSWKIAAIKAPIEFPSHKVAGVFFRSQEGARKRAPLQGAKVLRLANGDWFQGEVVSLDGQRLVMKSDLAPALNIPLSELRALYVNPNVVATLSDGASGSEMWNDGWSPESLSATLIRPIVNGAGSPPKIGEAWRYFDGGYTAPSSRTNNKALAKRWPAFEGSSAISFDAISSSPSPYFSVQLLDAQEQRLFSISLSGTRMYVHLAFRDKQGLAGALNPKNFTIDPKAYSQKDGARISLILDRPKKTIRFLFDGKEAGKIAANEDLLNVCGISLSSNTSINRGSSNRIARLWVAPWSATPETPSGAADKETAAEPQKTPDPEPEPKDAPKFAETIFLKNGDEFLSNIEKLTPELVVATSDIGALELPANRIAWIRFPGPERPPADHFPRLRFHDRGLLSVRDLQFTDDRVRCRTLDGQALDFPINVVKEVVWRPLEVH